MRVLLLSWDFPPKETGGTAAHVHGLSAALATAGHDSTAHTTATAMWELAENPALFAALKEDAQLLAGFI